METTGVTYVVAVLLAICGSSVAQTAEGNVSSEYSGNAKWLHGLPHNTVSGDSISGSIFEDSSVDYLSSLVPFAIVPMCIGIIGIIGGIIFCSIRFCCDSCGGRRARESGYETKEKTIIKILLLVNSVLIVSMVVVGLIGNSMFASFVDDLADQLEEAAAPQQALTESIEVNLVSIDANRTALKGFVAVLTERAVFTTENAQRGREYIADNDLWRLVILGFTYAVVLLTVIVGVISAMLGWPKGNIAAGSLSFFCIFMVWFNFGFHFPISVVLADVCYDVAEVTIPARLQSRSETGVEFGAVDKLCYCAGFGNANRTYDFANEMLEERIAEQEQLINDTLRYDELQDEIDLLEETMETTLYVRDCMWMLNVFPPLGPKTCGSNLTGAVIIWATSFVLSVLFVFHSIVTMLAYKRFSTPAFF